MVAAKAFASAATRGCGLKLEYAQPVDADFASAATRGCGLKRYEPVVNQSAESDKFMVSPEDYLRVEALGEIIALVHSHPDGEAAPSVADQQAHSVSGLDWIIIALNGDDVTHCVMPANTEKQPLMGRVFLHGVIPPSCG